MAIRISDDNSDERRNSRLFFLFERDDKLMVLFLFIFSKYKNRECKYFERKWDVEEFIFFIDSTLGYDLRVYRRWKFAKMF